MIIIHEFRLCNLNTSFQFTIGFKSHLCRLKLIKKILVISVSLIALFLLPLSVLSAITFCSPAFNLIKPMLTRYAVFLWGMTDLRIVVDGLDFLDNLKGRCALWVTSAYCASQSRFLVLLEWRINCGSLFGRHSLFLCGNLSLSSAS